MKAKTILLVVVLLAATGALGALVANPEWRSKVWNAVSKLLGGHGPDKGKGIEEVRAVGKERLAAATASCANATAQSDKLDATVKNADFELFKLSQIVEGQRSLPEEIAGNRVATKGQAIRLLVEVEDAIEELREEQKLWASTVAALKRTQDDLQRGLRKLDLIEARSVVGTADEVRREIEAVPIPELPPAREKSRARPSVSFVSK